MNMDEKIEMALKIRQRPFPVIDITKIQRRPVDTEEFVISGKNNRNIRVFKYTPKDGVKEPCAIFINFHGGGYLKGHADRDFYYCEWISHEMGALVLDVDYALAPEEPFPAAVEDAWSSYEYMMDHMDELNIDRNRVFLLGHSSGGGLVSALCQLIIEKKADIKPAAVLMEYFPADMHTDPVSRLNEEELKDEKAVQRAKTGRIYNQFYCEGYDTNPLVSPTYAKDEILAEFPPVLIITAGLDPLRNEDENFALKLVKLGVPVTLQRFKGSQHGFTINQKGAWKSALMEHKRFFVSYGADAK